jgi:hypothetical protein
VEQEVLAEGLTALDWLLAVAVLVGRLRSSGGWPDAWSTRRYAADDGEPGAADAIGRSVGLHPVAGRLRLRAGDPRGAAHPLLGAIGIGGIAIALAAQTVLTNALASTLLRLRHPFRRGDQIRTNDLEGRVIDVNFRTVVLVNMDG